MEANLDISSKVVNSNDRESRAHQVVVESDGTQIDKALKGFNFLIEEPVLRGSIVNFLTKYSEVFGDPEVYIKYLFQIGQLDAIRCGNTYEVFAA